MLAQTANQHSVATRSLLRQPCKSLLLAIDARATITWLGTNGFVSITLSAAFKPHGRERMTGAAARCEALYFGAAGWGVL